ncbi:MAG: hypothetical protein M5U34_40435 [Chloroflexi bacterium]|nr:hypothetical protein [Chloroflexota bacterium]
MTKPNPSPSPPEWPARLRDMLVEYFNLDDLALLCFDVGLDFEEPWAKGRNRGGWGA